MDPSALTRFLTLFHPVTDTRMSDEIVHNLDGCEISLVGDDLDPERESLLLDMASLQQRGLELTNTSAYLTIAGQWGPRTCALSWGGALLWSRIWETVGDLLPGPEMWASVTLHLPSLEEPLASRLPLEMVALLDGSCPSFSLQPSSPALQSPLFFGSVSDSLSNPLAVWSLPSSLSCLSCILCTQHGFKSRAHPLMNGG